MKTTIPLLFVLVAAASASLEPQPNVDAKPLEENDFSQYYEVLFNEDKNHSVLAQTTYGKPLSETPMVDLFYDHYELKLYPMAGCSNLTEVNEYGGVRSFDIRKGYRMHELPSGTVKTQHVFTFGNYLVLNESLDVLDTRSLQSDNLELLNLRDVNPKLKNRLYDLISRLCFQGNETFCVQNADNPTEIFVESVHAVFHRHNVTVYLSSIAKEGYYGLYNHVTGKYHYVPPSLKTYRQVANDESAELVPLIRIPALNKLNDEYFKKAAGIEDPTPPFFAKNVKGAKAANPKKFRLLDDYHVIDEGLYYLP